MSKELEKAYNPGANEDDIYKKWENSGYFNPDNLKLAPEAPSYTIVLPPPNITDKLHIGHSATVTIEDLMIRYQRLRGRRTLWLPGTDHAAIATQNVVEKRLFKESGQTRHDLGKERFLEEVWKFLQTTRNTILFQTKKMGASLDWSRLAFTLDDERQLAVRTLFSDMYQAGVIYRGERIVNWCPRCHSTLADDEVEYQEQAAKIYTFRYDRNFPISISTTRPETKLGDTAIAVNPKDERYQQYIGRELEANFCGQNLKIKVIADHNVEMDFGTGALGVTPAHSMVDWQMAQSNDLPLIKVIDEDARIISGFGKFSGLSAMEAREAIVAELKESGLLEKEEELQNNLSVCYRCNTAIEPLTSKQWFIAVDKPLERLGGLSLKEKALAVAKSGEIKFIPERFGKRYSDWMSNLHDWCISRQIWFGHQIPVWYRGEEIFVGTEAPTGDGWAQDPDTLDTWFSSGMWTFSTLGWPGNYQDGKKSGDLARFHPTQMLETGYEIITLWVSRMIMMSLFALGEIPFEKVYLHGMVLDKNGKKMSKSKGNGVDPLEIIPEYGTDAIRLALLMGFTPGNDNRFSLEKVEAKRNFVNKLWNISRYILSAVSEEQLAVSPYQLPKIKSPADEWIMGEFEKLVGAVSERFENHEFSLAAEELTEFTWNKFADWYLEIAKIEKDKEAILLYILKNLLILWHPFIPFVTEKIWSAFSDDLLMVAKWPEVKAASRVSNWPLIQEAIVSIRNARSENRVEPSKKLDAIIYTHGQAAAITPFSELIRSLKTGLNSLEIKESGEKPEQAIMVAVGSLEIYLLGAIDQEKDRERLAKEKANLERLMAIQEAKLNNQEFVSRAPENIVAAEQAKLDSYRQELDKIKAIANNL